MAADPAASSVAPARAPEVKEQAPQIAKARALAVTKTAPSRRLQSGDAICGNCGEGNAPSRKFCSRCGDSLVEAVHVKPKWWHRFRIERGPKTVKLGKEPGKGAKGGSLSAPRTGIRQVAVQIYRKGRIVVAVAIIAGGAVYAAYPPFRDQVNSIFTSEKTKLAGIVHRNYVPIHPIKCSSRAQVSGHHAGLVCDGFFNNYWLAPWSASHQPALVMTFEHPVTITRLILYNGAFGNYVADGRPSSIELVFSNKESFTITPQDSPKPQTFVIKHALLIKSITFHMTATYEGTKGSNVAVSQIELFGVQ